MKFNHPILFVDLTSGPIKMLNIDKMENWVEQDPFLQQMFGYLVKRTLTFFNKQPPEGVQLINKTSLAFTRQPVGSIL